MILEFPASLHRSDLFLVLRIRDGFIFPYSAYFNPIRFGSRIFHLGKGFVDNGRWIASLVFFFRFFVFI